MSGSVCPEPLIQKVFKKLNMHGLCIVYGMTELSPVATMMGPSAPLIKKTTTSGHPGPGCEVKIVDENN
jgi:fatty-acyl-CoA synthase